MGWRLLTRARRLMAAGEPSGGPEVMRREQACQAVAQSARYDTRSGPVERVLNTLRDSECLRRGFEGGAWWSGAGYVPQVPQAAGK